MSIGDYTNNYSVPLSNFDTATWIDEDWARWRMLDALIAAIDDADIPIVVATGAANAFVATYTPAVTAYALGLTLQFVANSAVTGASTINVNGLGAKALKINGVDTVTGDIPVNSYVKIIYNGTDFSVVDPKKPVNTNQNVITGVSGATPNAATDFYVESAGPTYVELLGPNSSTQGYMFSRPALGYAGGAKYDHVNDLYTIRVFGNDVFTIDASGFITAAKFIGAVQGNVVGNADTASALATSRTIAFTGNVTGTGSFNGSANYSAALTIAANVVTNAMLVDVPTATFKGRTTAGTGDPEDLTATQATALLNAVVGDSGAGGTKGIVPAPAAGSAADRKMLSAAGTFDKQVVFAYAKINGATGALVKGFNVASASRDALGRYSITFTDAAADANYVIQATASKATTFVFATIYETVPPTTGGCSIRTMEVLVTPAASAADCDFLHITIFE